MRLAKVRLIVSLIIIAAIVTFVLTSTTPTKVQFNCFGNELIFPASTVIFVSLAAGFVLGYAFRITHRSRRKAPKKPPS